MVVHKFMRNAIQTFLGNTCEDVESDFIPFRWTKKAFLCTYKFTFDTLQHKF